MAIIKNPWSIHLNNQSKDQDMQFEGMPHLSSAACLRYDQAWVSSASAERSTWTEGLWYRYPYT